MTGKSIGMSSEDNHTFRYVAVVISAECRNGVFTIEYNHALRNMLLQLRRNYSRLNLSIMLKFTSNYSFRLYELLKSKCYHSWDDQSPEQTFRIRFSLSELKLELGIVNADLDRVKRVLNNQENPDFDRAVEISPEKMLTNWSDFKRKALDRAVNEINDISDMRVTYDTIKRGQGGKVYGVDFTVTILDTKKKEKVELSEDQKIELLFEIRDLLGDAFSVKDIRSIAEAADYDMMKIQKAADLYHQEKDIENPTGWMIGAIRGGYEKAPAAGKAASKKRTGGGSFNAFEQHDYDFDSIEKAVLGKGAAAQ
jgi:plasmid replication initiation protein